jgi:hypothetical protein
MLEGFLGILSKNDTCPSNFINIYLSNEILAGFTKLRCVRKVPIANT